MAPLEAVFFWAAVCLYGTTAALYIYSFVFGADKALGVVNWMLGVSLLVHTAAILARYQAVGNLPVAGDYENGLSGAWVIAAFTLYVSLRHKGLRVIGVATLPVLILMMGYGVMRNPQLAPMVAAVRSFWLYVHVLFAWLAYGAFTLAFGAGVVYLLKEKHKGGNPKKEAFYQRFPALERLDDLMFKYMVFGFITDAVMIASGAVWAKDLWGNYWGWDPVETWSLITWVIYGLAIHLRVTMGWRGRRFAWVAIFALAGMVITFFGINLFVESSLHIFEAWQKV